MARRVLKKRKQESVEPKLPTRRITFRIYPTPGQEAILVEWLGLHCELYNAAIQERRDAWKRCGIGVNYVAQANQLPEIKALRPELLVMGAHALQATLRRADLAFQHYFDRVKAKKDGSRRKVGYPRFKARARFKGWTYPDHDNWKLLQATPGKHGFLDIKHLGKLRIRGKARTWGVEAQSDLSRLRKADEEVAQRAGSSLSRVRPPGRTGPRRGPRHVECRPNGQALGIRAAWSRPPASGQGGGVETRNPFQAVSVWWG